MWTRTSNRHPCGGCRTHLVSTLLLATAVLTCGCSKPSAYERVQAQWLSPTRTDDPKIAYSNRQTDVLNLLTTLSRSELTTVRMEAQSILSRRAGTSVEDESLARTLSCLLLYVFVERGDHEEAIQVLSSLPSDECLGMPVERVLVGDSSPHKPEQVAWLCQGILAATNETTKMLLSDALRRAVTKLPVEAQAMDESAFAVVEGWFRSHARELNVNAEYGKNGVPFSQDAVPLFFYRGD